MIPDEHYNPLRSWRPGPVDRGVPCPAFLGTGEGQGSVRPHRRLARGGESGTSPGADIDAASVNTGNGKRDEHLRSGDFFDTERHPDVHFVSSQVSNADDDDLRVQGELLAAGERVALELRPTMRQADDRIEVDASATIDQRQLGMTWSPLGITRTPTLLTVHAHLRPQ